MDTWETRYMHEGRTYVRDDYSGTTIPLDIYLKMGSPYVPPALAPQVITKHPFLRKMVKFSWGGQEVIGKVRKVTSTSEGDCAEIRVPGSRSVYFIGVVKLQQV